MNRRASLAGVVAIAPLLLVATSCGRGDSPEAEDVTSDRCVVRLHGKGESGSAPELSDDGVAILNPDGNGSGWGARQWEYDSVDARDAGRDRIADAADRASCRRVVVHGFSNGASMAAALFCSGDRLDGRLVGVVIDDPVTDAATTDCRPADVPVEVYWTTALDQIAPPGTSCESVDWTCAGDVVRGIGAFAADLGVAPTPSPFADHRWYLESPLPVTWLG